MLACAALLFAACGGTQGEKEGAETVEPRTEVTYGEQIALLPVAEQGGLTINEALRNRRSWREYNAGTLSLEELSGVLWAAAGENRPSEGRLTAPSALALYPVRVYAILAEGAYLYDAKAHTLTRVAEGDLRKLSGAQEFVFSAPLNLVYVADLSVYDGREIPAERARYLCGQDAAGYAENVNLYTAGHGLRSITRGSAPEAELLAALGVDADRCFLGGVVASGFFLAVVRPGGGCGGRAPLLSPARATTARARLAESIRKPVSVPFEWRVFPAFPANRTGGTKNRVKILRNNLRRIFLLYDSFRILFKTFSRTHCLDHGGSPRKSLCRPAEFVRYPS